MKQKSLVLILGVVALSAIMIISAASVFTMTMPMTANVAQTGAVTVTINSVNYNTGQSLNIDWGNVASGQVITKEITINNQVNTAVTPSISTTDIPAGWTLELSSTSPISAFGSSTCNIVLTVGTNPVMADYSWSATLNVAT
ncbi:MAG: hypothetical protein NWE93_12120 [Candidatus Bathyarchaeota archaeon]|nr:hypothetical protein [Candidatus Bathyarchaeota archaeon]